MTLSVSKPDSSVQVPPTQKWHQATWEEYVALRDAPMPERMRLAFNQGWL